MASANAAREGDKVIEVICRCGKQYIRLGALADWWCRCRRKQVGPTVELGKHGALPV